jgi:hypothetical protein
MRVGAKSPRARGNALPIRFGYNGSDLVPVREDAVFEPTLQDLKLVQAYLAREIKRLQARHEVITRRIAGR